MPYVCARHVCEFQDELDGKIDNDDSKYKERGNDAEYHYVGWNAQKPVPFNHDVPQLTFDTGNISQ
jgi:hypothetical protein